VTEPTFKPDSLRNCHYCIIRDLDALLGSFYGILLNVLLSYFVVRYPVYRLILRYLPTLWYNSPRGILIFRSPFITYTKTSARGLRPVCDSAFPGFRWTLLSFVETRLIEPDLQRAASGYLVADELSIQFNRSTGWR
jgi:hypothetical protein